MSSALPHGIPYNGCPRFSRVSLRRFISRLAVLCLCLLSTARAFPQYVLTPVPPPPQFTFNDLWHLTLTKTTAEAYKTFYLALRVTDGQNRLLLKSNSAVFILGTGSRYFNRANLSELEPFQTSHYDAPGLQQVIATGGVFPPGTYLLQYILYGKADDGAFSPLAENTLELNVEALWPPMLLSPPDGDSIDVLTPLLTWTPAFSGAAGGSMDYTLRLVEKMPGQNAYQAIQANPVYFTQSGIPVSTLAYPPGARALETGKTYAWQVHAQTSSGSLGASEVWVFTPKAPTDKAPGRLPGQYFRPAPQMSPEFMQLREAFLPIAFDERYQPSEIREFSFRILDGNRNVLGTQKDFGAALKTGFNRYLIPVCSSEGKISLPKGKYFLEILLEKKTSLYLAFEIAEKKCHE